MTDITGSQPTIAATEKQVGLVSLQQTSESGEAQIITIDLHQVESLANWLTQYMRSARDDISDD